MKYIKLQGDSNSWLSSLHLIEFLENSVPLRSILPPGKLDIYCGFSNVLLSACINVFQLNLFIQRYPKLDSIDRDLLYNRSKCLLR